MFEWNNMPNYNMPTQNNNYQASGGGSYWGADIPKMYSAPNYIAEVNKPRQPSQQHPVQGKYENTLAQMANVTAPNYVNEFSSYYNDLMNKLFGMTQGQQGSTNAGLGQYDMGRAGQGQYNVGEAGLGQYNVGDAGLGMFDYQNTPLAGYNVQNSGQGTYDLPGDVGTGAYNSNLMDKLTGRVTSNLTNPNASLAMGLARDQIQGQGIGARQQLSDSFAGLGGRGQGPAQAQMAQLGNSLNQQQSDAYRNIAMDTERNAIGDAQNLEQMKGGFFNDAQGRQLQNAGLGMQAFESGKGRELQAALGQGDIYKNLANIGLQSFEGARGGQLSNAQLGSSAYSDAQSRALQNAGMGQSSYQDAMNRQLQGATLGADTFNQARQRELANAQLNNSIYQGNAGNSSAIAAAMAGLLPNMSQFLQNQGNMDVNAENQQMSNYQNLNSMDMSRKAQELALEQQYQKQYDQWLKDMMSWQNGRTNTGRQF
jgi:hypothetical protein